MANKKILLVDDADLTLMMEKMMLRSDEYELITASDGEEALEKIATHSPDLVVLDIRMPKLDGIEVCRRIRDDPATKDLPVLIVTVVGEDAAVERAFDAGCTDYCTKPLDQHTLRTKVTAALAKS